MQEVESGLKAIFAIRIPVVSRAAFDKAQHIHLESLLNISQEQRFDLDLYYNICIRLPWILLSKAAHNGIEVEFGTAAHIDEGSLTPTVSELV
jgi:hypothetical protein